jgi:hypothetical protein
MRISDLTDKNQDAIESYLRGYAKSHGLRGELEFRYRETDGRVYVETQGRVHALFAFEVDSYLRRLNNQE